MLWEAQFGDFVNGAQVIVDQFIASGLAKWGQTSRLTLLLPHGYEGSGPEHSSARLERFLSLAAEGNLRIANLTTPAQYFHLLRRQAKIVKQRPLIVMTPKSLLRLPQATSRLDDLSERRVPAGPRRAGRRRAEVTRLILCTGKIYYDLVGHPERAGNERRRGRPRRAALPVPRERAARAVAALPQPPRGRLGAGGAAQHGRARLHGPAPAADHAAPHLRYGYIGRPERASPGEGYPAAHVAEQSRIVAPRSTSPSRSRVPGEDARASDSAVRGAAAPGCGARQPEERSSGSRSPRSTARSTTTQAIPRAAASTRACGLICWAASTPRQSLIAGSRRIRSR